MNCGRRLRSSDRLRRISSHGVVDSGERVKRYGQLLETEARRLGEMVERVLQYAGIESGLATGARVPVAPTEIIEGAIESSLPLLGSERHHDRAQIHSQSADGCWAMPRHCDLPSRI